MRRHAADIAIERQATRVGSRLSNRKARPKNRIGAQPRLVRRAVQLDHRAVDLTLIFSIHTNDCFSNIGVHRVHRALHALTQPQRLVTIAPLNRLMRAG